ncbi:hypothetical protein KIPB_012322, partial [Kipferlia bialata]
HIVYIYREAKLDKAAKAQKQKAQDTSGAQAKQKMKKLEERFCREQAKANKEVVTLRHALKAKDESLRSLTDTHTKERERLEAQERRLRERLGLSEKAHQRCQTRLSALEAVREVRSRSTQCDLSPSLVKAPVKVESGAEA